MNTIDEIVECVYDNIPHYNRELLVNFPREAMKSALPFVDTCMKEGVKLNPGAISYLGYERLSPEERARYELSLERNDQKIPTVHSELSLYRFNFKHHSRDGDRNKTAYLYLPYLHDDFLVVDGKKLGIRKGIAEKVFIRDTDPDKRNNRIDGEIDVVLFNPIRVRVRCRRYITQTLISAKDGQSYSPVFVIIVKAHTKEHKKRKVGTTIVLHLLAKYGFNTTIEKIGLNPDDFQFVEQVDQSDHDHDYFEAKNGLEGHSRMFYLKVSKENLKNRLFKKTVAELIYLLSNFGFQHRGEIHDKDGSVWRSMLGKIISSDDNDLKARDEADNHILSADSFLDPLTRERYRSFNVNVEDFYDMLCYVYLHIDEIIVNTPPQDLYDRTVDISHSLFIAAYAKPIFLRFYKGQQKTELKESEVHAILRVDSRSIEHPYSKGPSHGADSMEVITQSPTRYNDNWLTAVGIHKMRRAGHADQEFHPSVCVVESVMALSGKDSAKSGHLNPFLQIDQKTGAIRKDLMPWCQDVDNLLRYIQIM